MSSSTKHLQIITRHRHNWRCRFHHIPETLTCWYTQTKCHYCLVFVKILPEQEICHYMHRLPTRGCWPLLAMVSTSVRLDRGGVWSLRLRRQCGLQSAAVVAPRTAPGSTATVVAGRHRGMAHWDGTQVWHLTHVLLTQWTLVGLRSYVQVPREGPGTEAWRGWTECPSCWGSLPWSSMQSLPAIRPTALHQLFLARMNWMSVMQSIYYKHMKYNAIWWNVVHKNNNIHHSQGD